jgi:hypothetical protein
MMTAWFFAPRFAWTRFPCGVALSPSATRIAVQNSRIPTDRSKMCWPALSPPTNEIALMAGSSHILLTVGAVPWTLLGISEIRWVLSPSWGVHVEYSWRQS